MKTTSIECDRCGVSGPITDSWWTLSFHRDIIDGDMIEFESEAWDLCQACYEAVAPDVAATVDELKEPVEQ